jgi:glycosyltransferase involved in cell wall biosynthesis
MRIGFDTTPLSSIHSGIGTYTANMLNHLQHQPDAEVIQLSHRHPHGRYYLNKTLWMQAVLPLQINWLNLDICHFTNNVAPVRLTCPMVMTIHDMTVWLHPEYHFHKRLISMRPLIPLASHQAGAIITVSHSVKGDIVNILGIPAHKVHVIYEAPSADFRPLPRDESLEGVRTAYCLPERFILFVGTLEPRKNLVRLLQALAQLHHNEFVPHHLVIVGAEGWKTRQIYQTIEELQLSNVVHMLGYVPQSDLIAMYNLADVLSFPSLYEGFGLPVVEAMACGTPVLTSRRGALEEVAGIAAEYVDPMDVESIARGLYRVLANPERQAELRTLGFETVRRFSWQIAAQQTRQVYDYVLERS